MFASPYLTLYVYPEEADYDRSTPLSPTVHRLDSSVRTTDAPFSLPEQLQGDGKLIYVSLGSLGSAEPELMGRLVDLLGRTSHRVIISLGAQAGQLRLPENVYGEEFLPQPSVLPLVDAVITHGGNNTTTECFYFGKPMLALPLFWDQHDNAQRIDELDFGHRFAPYGFSDADFLAALDDVLYGPVTTRTTCGHIATVAGQSGAGQSRPTDRTLGRRARAGSSLMSPTTARLRRQCRPRDVSDCLQSEIKLGGANARPRTPRSACRPSPSPPARSTSVAGWRSAAGRK